MDRSATLSIRPAMLRLGAIVALGAALAACASDTAPPPPSGSSAPAAVLGDWKHRGYKLDWTAPDFGGPPPGAH